MKFYIWCLLIVISMSTAAPLAANATSVSTEKITKYRVYQNNKVLMEYANYNQALAYAKQFANSYIEEIGSRKWLWNNFPRYQVYEKGVPLAAGSFANVIQAQNLAKQSLYRSIRDLQSGGWIWQNYPRYRIYQMEFTQPSWEFTLLPDATREAKKWADAYIIDLQTNRWIWDNFSVKTKSALRNGEAQYRLYQGEISLDSWKFSFLEDAYKEALNWSNSSIVNINTQQVVFQNSKMYAVYQLENLLQSFISLDEAIAYAKKWAFSKIVWNDQTIWTNSPFYQVMNQSQVLGQFSTIPQALDFAMQTKEVTIVTLDQLTIWDNLRKLQIWGWTGKQTSSTLLSQANGTMGLDVISPTFFELADANGNLKDYANTDVIQQLNMQGFRIHPLVHNQFNSQLTTSFLNNAQARQNFITQLVNRVTELGLPGINIDFENLAGSNRAVFTTFIQELTQYAKQKNLIVSIDLPRGDLLWNQATAFDHEKIGQIVDYVHIMAYDQFWSGSKTPGSVATMPWVETGITDYLSYGIPRQKIVLGVPFYVREWKLDASGKLISNRAVTMKDLKNILLTKPITSQYDDLAKQTKISYSENGFTYTIWVEDETSMKNRMELAKKYDLSGIAAWRLGYDFPELWQMILQNK